MMKTVEEVKERDKAYRQRPEIKAHKKEYLQRPEVKTQKMAYHKAYRKAHREQGRKYQLAYRAAHHDESKEYQKTHWLQRKYGLTRESFDAMLAGQGGVCAICGTKDWGLIGPHVDHDHATGAIRGILCGRCNVALGLLRDDPRIALAALKYLERT